MKKYQDPICNECKFCIKIDKEGRVRSINCRKNPNLGAVTVSYQKCCSFKQND